MKSFSTVTAGLALASSWTWVIGMYLPRILLERYGWLGFFIFAVPNVLGCAAFGKVLSKAGSADELRRKVTQAARWFSCATISFHTLFAVFLCKSLLPEDGTPMPAIWAAIIPAVLLFTAWGLSYISVRHLVSLGALIWVASMFVLSTRISLPLQISPNSPPLDALYLMPLTAMGFLLCPYLDLTFHEVRKNYPMQAFGVFGVGFGFMLMLTVMIWMTPRPHLQTLALMHISWQALFTTTWHLGALRREEFSNESSISKASYFFALRGLIIPSLVAAGCLLFFDGNRANDQAWYLRFLFLYGGLFPAALLLRFKYGTKNMVPALAVFAVVSMVPGELSFVRNQPVYALIPFIALMLILLLKRRGIEGSHLRHDAVH